MSLWSVARGLVFTVADGATRVWNPRRRTLTTLDPDVLAFLLRFGEGATIENAAAASGHDLDDVVREAVDLLVEAGLLVAPSPPRGVPPSGRARARIDQLVDPGSFEMHGEVGVITGHATIDGRPVALAAWESFASTGIENVLQLQERALAEPRPVIYLLDTFVMGSREVDFTGPRAVGRIYANHARLSGLAPQIAIVYGALWRPAALLPVGCDTVVFVGGQGFVHIGDRDIVKEMTGEEVTQEALGGAQMHAEASGLGHLIATSPAEAATLVRRYLAFFPTHRDAPLPIRESVAPPDVPPAVLDALVPDDADTSFAMSEVVRAVFDEGSLLELRASWARELSTTLARLAGKPVGVVANCSTHRGGILTPEAADKAARFVALCDAYGLPIVFLVDVLGMAIGRAAERAGIERAAGRLFAALATAEVAKLTVVVRRAHTAGLFAMCGPAFDPDVFIALPTASISILSERRAIQNVAALERQLDVEAREALRGYLRTMRTPPHLVAHEVVALSQARATLDRHLKTIATRTRSRRHIPP